MQGYMNTELLQKINQIGKGGIVREGIFVRFPDLLPAVREHYWREDGRHRKLLFIGESNYFNDNDIPQSDFLDAELWYKGAEAKLIPENRKKDVNNDIGYKTFNKVFNIMGEVLDDNGITHLDGLGEAAFYNYFLRPAYNNGKTKGFRPQQIDREVAGEALVGIINCVNPDLVVFLSKLAFLSFENYLKSKSITFEDVKIEQVSHPSSPWWNRWNGVLGKAKLKDILRNYWVRH